jgi:hypothetical protein
MNFSKKQELTLQACGTNSVHTVLRICGECNKISVWQKVLLKFRYPGKKHNMQKKTTSRKVWSSEYSGIYCRVVKPMSTDVSEVRAASIIRAMSEPSSKVAGYIRVKWNGLTNGEWVSKWANGTLTLTLYLSLSLFYYGPPTHLSLALVSKAGRSHVIRF